MPRIRFLKTLSNHINGIRADFDTYLLNNKQDIQLISCESHCFLVTLLYQNNVTHDIC